eukprot:6214173-Pleurochrysis_carterae.AAC.1
MCPASSPTATPPSSFTQRGTGDRRKIRRQCVRLPLSSRLRVRACTRSPSQRLPRHCRASAFSAENVKDPKLYCCWFVF